MAESQSKKVLAGLALGAVLLGLLVASQLVCLPAFFGAGVLVPRCPDGDFRQTLSLSCGSVRRGQEGHVSVSATAHYVRDAEGRVEQAPVRRLSAELFLVDAAGKETKLAPIDGWEDGHRHVRTTRVKLPEVPDGDYKLRAKVETPIDEGTVDVPLAIYAPARVHVLTDRPLYEPGNTVKFRALAVRARDLVPLDGRPGRWVVTDPTGEVLLEERAPAGSFGVVAGSFPLDAGAATGDWRVRWESGDAREERTFRVEPFTLPRFRIEASAPKAFYRAGERPVVRGSVVYSSGAPVGGATVTADWTVSGGWPPPTSWSQGALPKTAKVDGAGRFTLELPAIPADLRGQATIVGRLGAVDPAGDRVEGAVSVLLSEDAIAATAVTELEGGLVAGFNNRVYLRVTTADGTVLPKAELLVKRAWEPGDPGVKAATDEDGVASLQLDPGPPVNVVIPPMPARVPPRPPAIRRGETREVIFEEEPPLADHLALDRLVASLEPCARFSDGSATAMVGLRVSAGGTVTSTVAQDAALSRCLARALDGRQLAAGRERLYWIRYDALSTHLPGLEVSVDAVPEADGRVQLALEEAAQDARTCLPEETEGGTFPELLAYRTVAGRRGVELSWIRDPDGLVLPASVVSCVRGKFAGLTLRDPAGEGGEAEPIPAALGTARLDVTPAQRMTAARPQAMTMLGYELRVVAKAGGEELGATTLRMTPGDVPAVRLRATPVLAKGGDTVELEILRGPSFRGELPEKLWLRHELRAGVEAKVDKETRKARFQLPREADGFWEVGFHGATARVYVRPETQLAVEVEAAEARYAPGQTAKLHVRTSAGGQGKKAAVGLFGVDRSLAQLAPLPGPDELSSLRTKIQVSAPAFGVLDGQALSMGRIRGANAAAATVLKISQVPAPAELDSYVSASGSTVFDPNEELTDRFYAVLGELHRVVRRWEDEAPKDERMHPPAMARLWRDALTACEKRGERVDDAFGRRLRLSNLPQDLLALTDPRAVVIAGTRLPEDVESWTEYVAKERP